jgi:hypothetical protein
MELGGDGDPWQPDPGPFHHDGRRCVVRGLVAGFLPLSPGAGGSMAQAAFTIGFGGRSGTWWSVRSFSQIWWPPSAVACL